MFNAFLIFSSSNKKLFLKNADLVIAVSKFTKQSLINEHQLNEKKCKVFHNSLDPYFNTNPEGKLVKELKIKYQIKEQDQVIVTLTRLVSSEKYKGYDKVIEAIAHLIKNGGHYKYLIMGKYDEDELKRMNQLIDLYKLENRVFLCGFIPDEEISSYFNLGDIFVMPSQKEGFGIVFIEAMACGLPVIAGNLDGSVDALLNGELGILINPNDEDALLHAIQNYKNHPVAQNPKLLMQKTKDNFDYPNYRENLKNLLLN